MLRRIMTANGFGLMRYSLILLELTRNDFELQKRISKRISRWILSHIRFVEVLSEKLIEIDPTIPPLPMKDIVLCLYNNLIA